MASKYTDGKLVKAANITQKYTEKDVQDLLSCQDRINGPHYFLDHFFYIQHPVKGKLKYQAYEYQRRLVDSYHQHRFNVNLLPRQTGKCLTKDINIRIMNKITGEIREISIEDFYNMQKNSSRDEQV